MFASMLKLETKLLACYVFIKSKRHTNIMFVCKYCGKAFSSPQALAGHIGRVHSQRTKGIDETIEWLKQHYGEDYAVFVLLSEIIKLEKEVEEIKRGEEEIEDEELEDEEESRFSGH